MVRIKPITDYHYTTVATLTDSRETTACCLWQVGCDNCEGWFHGECVGISKDEACQVRNHH